MLEQMMTDAAERSNTKVEAPSLQRLCDTALEWDKTIKELEAKVEEAKKKLKETVEILIPAEMASLGLGDSTTTKAGHSIQLKRKIFASVNDKNRENVLSWLRSNGYGDIIKNQVIASFDKEHDADALRAIQYLNSEVEGVISIDQKSSVHSSTLQSLLGERLDKNMSIPIEEIGCYVATQAVVKLT